MSAVPIVTTILWGAASWQNHDSSPPQSVIILHSNVCLGLSNPYISSALWRQRKTKNTALYIPILLRGLDEAVDANDRCFIYSLWCTSHEHLVFSHPKNILTPNTKKWHPLIYCSTYFQAHSKPITSFSFIPQHYCYWMSLFSLESHLTGEPCDYFILSLIVARNYVLACMFCIAWCQQISIWNKQIESSIYSIKQVGFFLKIWWSEKEQRTQKIKILNWGTWNTEIHFIGTSGRVLTGKASIFSRMPKFCAPKLWL